MLRKDKELSEAWNKVKQVLNCVILSKISTTSEGNTHRKR